MLSIQPIRYKMDTGVRGVGGESNASDETAYVKLGGIPTSIIYATLFTCPCPHDGEHISIQLMYRT